MTRGALLWTKRPNSPRVLIEGVLVVTELLEKSPESAEESSYCVWPRGPLPQEETPENRTIRPGALPSRWARDLRPLIAGLPPAPSPDAETLTIDMAGRNPQNPEGRGKFQAIVQPASGHRRGLWRLWDSLSGK